LLEGDVMMSHENKAGSKTSETVRKRRMLIAIGAAMGMAAICFVVVTFLPPPKGPFFEDPLRSLLTGLCVLGVACPLCIAGFTLKRKFAASPYFEGAFIAAVINVFGFVCAAVGLVCIGFAAYDLISRFLGSR
jgi:hypothetical protein